MSEERIEAGPGTPRRAVFAGAGAVGAAAVLAACDSEGDFEVPDAPDAAGEAGTVLADTGDVAVGGGVILADREVVITQPAEGEFRAFSAACTHLGCIVSDVNDGLIECACHESRFSIEDGSVVQRANVLGPDEDQDPLPEVAIEVDGSEISLA